MHPVLLKIGSFELSSHGVFMVLGIVLAIVLALATTKRLPLNRDSALDNLVIAILAGIIGARLSYFIIYNYQFKHFQDIFSIWDGGLVSFGGFIFGALALMVLLKYQYQPLRPWLDALTPPFFLGLFFARIGDLLSGEYAGKYLMGKKILNYFSVFPVPLFESAIALLLFIATLYLYERMSRKKPGLLFGLSAISYLIFRFIIDFWRDDASILLGMSLGQIVGLLLIVAILFFGQITPKAERSLDENRGQVS